MFHFLNFHIKYEANVAEIINNNKIRLGDVIIGIPYMLDNDWSFSQRI